jgi:hypothetical protein
LVQTLQADISKRTGSAGTIFAAYGESETAASSYVEIKDTGGYPHHHGEGNGENVIL